MRGRLAGQPEDGSFQQIAIVGVGLIGASFGLAMRQAGFGGDIVGVSSPRSIAAGIKAGAISRGVTLDEAAADADLIYLAQPIDEIVKTLSALGSKARKESLITDAGSTKSTIVDTAKKFVRKATFLGGHPMAGKEARGAEAAEADLFKGRPYVLTPTSGDKSRSEFVRWLERIGAQVYEMTPREHDETVALTSHLPQLLSTGLAAVLSRQDNRRLAEIFGPGLLDMTRLALSAPDVWMSVLKTNRAAVTSALASYKSILEELESLLEHGDISVPFAEGAQFASSLRKQSRISGTNS